MKSNNRNFNQFHIRNILNLWNVAISSCKGLLFFCWFTLLFIQSISAQCGLDIFIANDQSGSVDGIENAQSRAFITSLASTLDLGTKEDQIRIAIADWDSQNNWVQYDFPESGKNHTALMSDVIAYQNSNRVLGGGTDLAMALRNTYEMMVNNPNKRSVPEMIILLTDVSCGATIDVLARELAQQIMAEGIFIAVFAIDAAYNCPSLSEIASPGGHFDAFNYEDLEIFGVEYTNTLIGVACSNIKYVYDFNIKIDSYNADKCFPGPGNYRVDYSIQNKGIEDYNQPLTISFYDENPSLPSAKLIGVQTTQVVHLPKGEIYKGTYTDDALKYYETVYAIVNFDGSQANHKVPLYPQTLHPLLVFEGERTALNNFSNGAIRNNSPSCIPTATIQVDIQSEGVGCGDIAIYTANICNTGNADAIISNTLPIPAEGFHLIKTESSVDSTKSTHWASYYGGNIHDYIYASTIDKWGNVYLLGQTNSTVGIASLNAHQVNNAGDNDAFLVKLSSKGKRIWATYFGGIGNEDGFSITTDLDGNVIITGQTQNSALLSTSNAHQSANGGSSDAYLAKFNPLGELIWSTYYGGIGIDKGKAVLTDSEKNIYLLGDTESGDNIATVGSMQNSLSGQSDAFLVKFNSNGQRIWATYIGGDAIETGFGLTIDKMDNIYITGLTASTNKIAFGGKVQINKGVGNDAYLIKISKNGSKVWGSYLGGNGNDSGTSLDLDNNGDVYISGNVSSNIGFASANAHQKTIGGGTDAFLSKFSSDGDKLWATYYGGAATDNGRNVVVDFQDNVYLTGYSLSANNISTSDGIQSINGGGADAFIAKFDRNGNRIWGTYFGGLANDYGLSIIADPLGKLYLAGATQSISDITTDLSYQPIFGGGPYDGYLLKIDESYSFILKAGECAKMTYYYNTQNASLGNHDFSFLVEAQKNQSSDGEPNILPDTNFDILDNLGVNGYLGSLHFKENLTVSSSFSICPTGDLVDIKVDFIQNSSCKINDAPIIAEITINNQTGLNLKDLSLSLNLTDSDATFVSEPYQISSDLKLALANPFQNNYPNIPNALNQHSGEIFLSIYQLPKGISQFKVNIQPSSNATQLDVFIRDIPTIYSSTGLSNIGTDIQNKTTFSSPEIFNWSCPVSVNSSQNILLNGISTQFTEEIFWSSNTKTSLQNIGTIQQPILNYALNPKDIANGYVDISLQIKNNQGCTEMKFCRVLIENVSVDYGDAPKSYDLEASQKPVAASATISNEIFLGKIKPTAESAVKQSIKAKGDGVEEDALVQQCYLLPTKNSEYKIKIGATNNSSKPAFLNAFIDWNQEGNWNKAFKKAKNIIQIPPNSAFQEYEITWNIPANITLNSDGVFLRVRLSSDSSSVIYSFGNSPEGEIEDHWIQFSTPDIVNITEEICSGDKYVFGSNEYFKTGVYKNTLTSVSGCDSVVILNLLVKDFLTESINVNICSGDKYVFGSKEYFVTGIYTNTLTSFTGCDSVVILNLLVNEPIISTDTLSICKGGTIIWNNIEYSSIGDFQEFFLAGNGCDSLALLNINWSNECEEDQDCYLIFPNVFSPNNDGVNDLFRPIKNCNVSQFSLEIYNRWGVLVFTTNQVEQAWDGKINGDLQSQDNYIFQVVYSFENEEITYFKRGGLLLLK